MDSIFDSSTNSFKYEKGIVDMLSPCPGRYCGRSLLSNGSWSECGACERGTRRNISSSCEPCTDAPQVYDWLYLCFMMLVPLVLQLYTVDFAVQKFSLRRFTYLVHLCVFFEVIVASLLTLLLTPPMGYLTITSCNPRDLSDWYPILHNPNPNYEGQLHCTNEAVYPLYSMVLVAYLILLVTLCSLRPLVTHFVSKLNSTASHNIGCLYAALYLLPVLSVVHALFAGIIHTIFPFLVIIGSVISLATYLAHKKDQVPPLLFIACVQDVRSVLIILGHWLLHAYGISSLTQYHDPPQTHIAMCALVPLPTLFYIITARFADPSLLPFVGRRSPLARVTMSLAPGNT